MKTIEITVTDEQAAWISQQSELRGWSDHSLTLVEGVAARMQQDDFESDWDEDELRKEIMIGVEQAERGQVVDGPSFMNNLIARMEADQARMSAQ